METNAGERYKVILLISKNEELAGHFKEDVEQEGFKTHWISETDQLLITLHQLRDIRMVVLDMKAYPNLATDVFHKMKHDPEMKNIPIICMVRKDLVIEQLIAFELGADEFLYVPYTTTELQLKIRSLERFRELQTKLLEKEQQLKTLHHTQQVLVTLSHYINNALTPLYTLVQMVDESNPEHARRLKEHGRVTVEFISKVLATLHKVVNQGEYKVVHEGAYKNLMIDIENELKALQKKLNHQD